MLEAPLPVLRPPPNPRPPKPLWQVPFVGALMAMDLAVERRVIGAALGRDADPDLDRRRARWGKAGEHGRRRVVDGQWGGGSAAGLGHRRDRELPRAHRRDRTDGTEPATPGPTGPAGPARSRRRRLLAGGARRSRAGAAAEPAERAERAGSALCGKQLDRRGCHGRRGGGAGAARTAGAGRIASRPGHDALADLHRRGRGGDLVGETRRPAPGDRGLLRGALHLCRRAGDGCDEAEDPGEPAAGAGAGTRRRRGVPPTAVCPEPETDTDGAPLHPARPNAAAAATMTNRVGFMGDSLTSQGVDGC